MFHSLTITTPHSRLEVLKEIERTIPARRIVYALSLFTSASNMTTFSPAATMSTYYTISKTRGLVKVHAGGASQISIFDEPLFVFLFRSPYKFFFELVDE